MSRHESFGSSKDTWQHQHEFLAITYKQVCERTITAGLIKNQDYLEGVMRALLPC